ncbi:FkbM family methyltransferase [Bdellovibrio svalbardensis]|uniref:FkbM family methyltransferase n=1 Tax=Bdellovibrio svalbardensis TaxID=2972972 RepID=A0ABT6DG14_9BACT|nr:FkbM family methyltransferase [Bdellovibrio svalbardensis]MDG0815789.1 FkbM family methyltransferase [Bdellovibrio svalbardensis]
MQKFEIFPGESFYLNLHPEKEILSEIIREKGFYSYNDLYVFRKILSAGGVFVDVGANIGWHTISMASYLSEGQVIAFEPDVANFRLLEENTKKNDFSNVICAEKALSNYNGPGQLSLSGANFGDHILDPTNLLDPRSKVRVDVVTGDSYFWNQENLKRMDLIKIDAQGSECKILEGFKKIIQHYQPAIMIEYSPRHISAAGDSVFEIFAFIEKSGYFPFQIVEDLDREPNRLLDFVSIENLLSATKVLMERGTGVDLLLLKPQQIEHLQRQGFVL